MKDFHKAIITGAIIGASLGLIATHAHAQAVGQANHGHHGGGNSGAMGAAAGAFGGHAASGNAGTSGQSGNGAIYDCDITHYVLCSQTEAAK